MAYHVHVEKSIKGDGSGGSVVNTLPMEVSL